MTQWYSLSLHFPGTHDIVTEWFWLHTFAIALRTAYSLAHRHPFPETFVELASCNRDMSTSELLDVGPDPLVRPWSECHWS